LVLKNTQLMKKSRYITIIMAMFIGFSLTSTLSSCRAKKEGCGLEDQYSAQSDKKTGQLTTKRGSSNLFDKKRVAKSKKRKG